MHFMLKTAPAFAVVLAALAASNNALAANPPAASVQQIFTAYCTECHHAGHAPDLTPAGEDLRAWKARISVAVSNGTMPPGARDKLPGSAQSAIRSWAVSPSF